MIFICTYSTWAHAQSGSVSRRILAEGVDTTKGSTNVSYKEDDSTWIVTRLISGPYASPTSRPTETVDNNYPIYLTKVGQFLKSFTHKKVSGLLGLAAKQRLMLPCVPLGELMLSCVTAGDWSHYASMYPGKRLNAKGLSFIQILICEIKTNIYKT